MDFFCAMFENSEPEPAVSSSPPSLGFVQCWQTMMCLQISAEQVIRKNVFLIFLFQQNRFTRPTSVKGMLLSNLLN